MKATECTGLISSTCQYIYIKISTSLVFDLKLLMDIKAIIKFIIFCYSKEELMRGKAGYEHLNEPLHVIVEAELPVEIIDARLAQAREILEDLLKPVVIIVSYLFGEVKKMSKLQSTLLFQLLFKR